VIDCSTKWIKAIPLNIRIKTVVQIFVSQIVCRHGISLEVYIDQGKSFESKIFREMMCLLSIRKTRTTLHPQSGGQVKCHHQTVLNYLANIISEN